jgi:hypothetical protein
MQMMTPGVVVRPIQRMPLSAGDGFGPHGLALQLMVDDSLLRESGDFSDSVAAVQGASRRTVAG